MRSPSNDWSWAPKKPPTEMKSTAECKTCAKRHDGKISVNSKQKYVMTLTKCDECGHMSPLFVKAPR